MPEAAIAAVGPQFYGPVLRLYERVHRMEWAPLCFTDRELGLEWDVGRRTVWLILERLERAGLVTVVKGGPAAGGEAQPSWVHVRSPVSPVRVPATTPQKKPAERNNRPTRSSPGPAPEPHGEVFARASVGDEIRSDQILSPTPRPGRGAPEQEPPNEEAVELVMEVLLSPDGRWGDPAPDSCWEQASRGDPHLASTIQRIARKARRLPAGIRRGRDLEVALVEAHRRWAEGWGRAPRPPLAEVERDPAWEAQAAELQAAWVEASRGGNYEAADAAYERLTAFVDGSEAAVA